MIPASDSFNIRVFKISVPISYRAKPSPHTCPVAGITRRYSWGRVFFAIPREDHRRWDFKIH